MATESRTLVILALIANGLIAVLKFGAAAISGSSAMLAEGFHSVADTGNQLFLLRGSAVSRYAADVRHPYGRGKELYFWSFMVAVFLFVGGSVIAFINGWNHIRHPGEPENLWLNLTVLGLAALFEILIAFRPAVKEFNRRRGTRSVWSRVRESKDPALLVVLFEDTAAVIGVGIAAAGVILAHATGDGRWDGAASMVIGVLLAVTAFLLAYETKSLLIGEGASRQDRAAIRAAVLSDPDVEQIGRLLTLQMGTDKILVNVDVDFDEGMADDQIEVAIDRIEVAIRQAVPQAEYIFVEPETVA
jgi:cation diffusion facilitator family transporter